jgi:hypothetical protein
MTRRQSEELPPDIEVGAKVRARTVRFHRKPETKVEFEGGSRIRSDDRIEDIELDSVSHSERRNLPDEVEPGVTYHDVELGWVAQARARIPDEDER